MCTKPRIDTRCSRTSSLVSSRSKEKNLSVSLGLANTQAHTHTTRSGTGKDCGVRGKRREGGEDGGTRAKGFQILVYGYKYNKYIKITRVHQRS